MPRLKKKYMPKYQEPEPKATVAMMPTPCPEQWPAFMDYHTAARYISETYWTIRNLVKAGKLTAKKLGRRHTVARADLDKLWGKAEAA